MKKILLLTFICVLTQIHLTAQNNIELTINHKLGTNDFSMNQTAKNNMNQDFNLTRLEYYISEISLIHDGGTETLIEDLWILVNSSERTVVDLGSYNVSTVEKIKFYIGVDEDHNHLDPSTYESSHPLAPKSPSMHWGWSGGYRFIAVEGNGGSNLDQVFQLHCVGDNNYNATEIELDVTAENNQVSINLEADYTRALENIAVNTGVIVHGDNLQAKRCIENFRDYVFSPSSTTSSIINFDEVKSFNTYPNPVINGTTTISLEVDSYNSKYDISVSTVKGQQINYLNAVFDGQQINFQNQPSGIYLINLIKNGQTIITKKIFVK